MGIYLNLSVEFLGRAGRDKLTFDMEYDIGSVLSFKKANIENFSPGSF
jgi:hypothetical protein